MESAMSTNASSHDSTPDAKKRFWAFISYSSEDKKEAKWLRKKLENYPIPSEFQGETVFDGAKIGKNIRPVFRDRDDLSGAARLEKELLDRLERSRFLVVLCSKDSAESQWVNAEIETFKSLKEGNENRVLALILDGEPNASTSKKHPDNEECFPPALRKPVEPVAADLRKEGDGKERGFLKILAGVTELDFDKLYRRHERAQQKRRLMLGAAALVMISILTGLTLFALSQKSKAEDEQVRAEKARGSSDYLINTILNNQSPKLESIGHILLMEDVLKDAEAYLDNVEKETPQTKTTRGYVLLLKARIEARKDATKGKNIALEAVEYFRELNEDSSENTLDLNKNGLIEALHLSQKYHLQTIHNPTISNNPYDHPLTDEDLAFVSKLSSEAFEKSGEMSDNTYVDAGLTHCFNIRQTKDLERFTDSLLEKIRHSKNLTGSDKKLYEAEVLLRKGLLLTTVNDPTQNKEKKDALWKKTSLTLEHVEAVKNLMSAIIYAKEYTFKNRNKDELRSRKLIAIATQNIARIYSLYQSRVIGTHIFFEEALNVFESIQQLALNNGDFQLMLAKCYFDNVTSQLVVLEVAKERSLKGVSRLLNKNPNSVEIQYMSILLSDKMARRAFYNYKATSEEKKQAMLELYSQQKRLNIWKQDFGMNRYIYTPVEELEKSYQSLTEKEQ